MFVDIAKITVQAGKGGDGAVSFRREKYVASGGPDGGDGGNGGSILFAPDDNLSTLADFRYKRKYSAENGQNGRGARCTGKRAADLVIRVPRGTLVREAESGRILADISEDEPQLVARGGNGGWGNIHFATATRQTPRFAKPGQPGESYELQLELKLLADVGLVGYPNVGKSTLISVVSEAKPEIADYHFTTITPVLGVVRLHEGVSFVMADIPGLIEGAGEGAGLGHRFLRHVERCRLMVHVLDVSGSEGRDPISDFETICNELRRFNPELAERPMLVAANKCDLADEEQIERVRTYIEKKGYEFFPIMAAIRYDVDPLLNRIAAMLTTLPPVLHYEPEPAYQPDTEALGKKEVSVRRLGEMYLVEADWLFRLMQSVNFEDYESLQYFQRVLISTGVIDALREAGVEEGDTVSIYDLEFDFVD